MGRLKAASAASALPDSSRVTFEFVHLLEGFQDCLSTLQRSGKAGNYQQADLKVKLSLNEQDAF
jgi:hypothetical protein